jgi:hypothetical protein
MADSDTSASILRYNLISGVVEYFNGADYYPIATAPDQGITQLTGDVTAGPGSGSQAATVASVGGSTAAAVHTSVLATQAATASPTPNTLALRDAQASTQFRSMAINNTQSGGSAIIDMRATDTGQLSALILHNDSDTAQAYFAIGNSTNGNVLLRNSPSIVSPGLAFPLVMETQGFLPPLYTTANKNAISSPHAGLSLFDTDFADFETFNGTTWTSALPAVAAALNQYTISAEADFTGNVSFAKNPAFPNATAAPSTTLTPNADTSNAVDVTVSANLVISGPSFSSINDLATYKLRIRNDGSHSVTLATGAGNYRFSTDIPSYTNSVSLQDYIGVIFNSADNVWDVVSVIQGF